jgi:hypothetical protein
MVVLTVVQGDRLDSPAGVIRSLRQADPFPCSVTSLGHTDLFKALEPPACAEDPMATRHLIRAPGKREASASPQPLTTSIQPRSHGYRIYPDNLHLVRPRELPPRPHPPLLMGLLRPTPENTYQFCNPPCCRVRCIMIFERQPPLILPYGCTGCRTWKFGC